MRLFLSAALLTATALASDADDKAPKGDAAKIQGAWSGRIGPKGDVPVVYTFEGKSVTIRVSLGGAGGREITIKGGFRLDENAKPVKTIDWLNLADASGKSVAEKPGIYELVGDNTLKVCNAGPNNVRPTGFAGENGDAAPVVLTRLADPPKPKGEAKPRENAPAPAPCDEPRADAPRGDLAKLQGTWSARLGPEKNFVVTITFKGVVSTLKVKPPEGDEFETKGEIKLDETAKPHKTIDWVKFTRPTGEVAPENLGLYEFVDADTVRFCSGGPGNERPTEFKAGEGGPPNLVVMTREKEKPKDGEKGDGAVKGDLARLQGEWSALAGRDRDVPVTLSVKGRGVSVTFTTPRGEERTMKGEVVLNDAASPRTIDWVKFTRPDGEAAPPSLGIYTLEGDTFTSCSGGPNNDRPTEFKAGEGGPPFLVAFKRKK